MNLMDRYIARIYLINVLTLLVLLGGFVVTVDVFVNLTHFSEAATEHMESGAEDVGPVEVFGRTVLVIAGYWGPKLLQLFNYLVGLVMIGAMGFTCTQLVRQREFVALLASGVPLHRVMRPFALVALLLTGLQAVNQELIVPELAPLLTREATDPGRREIGGFPVRLVPDETGRIFSATSFDPEDERLTGVGVYERDERAVVVRVVRAEAAVWDGDGWALEEGRFTDLTTGVRDRPIERLDTALDPTRLRIKHLQGYGESLGWGQISEILEDGGLDPREAERLDRVRWGRVASMASNLVVLFACMPFFLTKLPGPMIVAGLKAAPVGLLGLVAIGMAPSMPIGGLPVWLGVFLPTCVLLPLMVALISGVRS